MIFFVGDPHNAWDLIIPPILERRPQAVVLLGDMELTRPLHLEMKPIVDVGIVVHFIPGNHDADTAENFANLFDSDLAESNLSGRVEHIDGLKVTGLGGVFRTRIWDPRDPAAPQHRNPASLRRAGQAPKSQTTGFRDGIALRHHVSIWPDDYDRLKRMRADILVTHEAPESHRHGWRALGELAEAMRVGKLIHGHHHTNYRGTTVNGVPVIGVALAGIVDQDGNIIAPGIEVRSASSLQSIRESYA